MVGIVIVSHSADIASGAAELAGQMAGPDVRIEAAGGDPDGGLGTDGARVAAAIAAADQGDGVVVLGDLGSAILTVRAVLDGDADGDRGAAQLADTPTTNGGVNAPLADAPAGGVNAVLADAPLVEGAVSAAVSASVGLDLEAVVRAAEEARGHSKL
jgi:phosphoenolpyruvate---glycerone phosphotransferase subunit DhaM